MKKLVLAILMTIFISPVFAAGENKEVKGGKETPQSIVLIGSVVDESTGEALAGAQVKLNSDNKMVYTDLDGNFEFRDLKAGTYNLEICLISYQENKIQNLVINAENKSAVKVELKR